VAEELDRRAFIGTARAAGVLALAGGFVAAVSASAGRALHSSEGRSATALRPLGSVASSTTTSPAAPTPAPSSTPTTAPPPPGTAIGAATDLSVGGAGTFTDPYTGRPAIALQPAAGQFRCFSAVCTHAGCTVGYQGGRFVCPCHGAEFDATTGDVIAGPANSPLTSIPIAQGQDGQLYVTS
jgi:thiosulfate dehydrogenase [quinone] large subunit